MHTPTHSSLFGWCSSGCNHPSIGYRFLCTSGALRPHHPGGHDPHHPPATGWLPRQAFARPSRAFCPDLQSHVPPCLPRPVPGHHSPQPRFVSTVQHGRPRRLYAPSLPRSLQSQPHLATHVRSLDTAKMELLWNGDDADDAGPMAAAIRELCGGGGETTHRGAVSSPVLQQLALAILAPNLASLEMQMGLISRNTGSYSGATASFTQPPTCRGASSPLPPRALLCACRASRSSSSATTTVRR